MKILMLILAAALLLPAEVILIPGDPAPMTFDTSTRILRYGDWSVASKGEFDVFPLLPTDKGLKRWQKLFEKAAGRKSNLLFRLGTGEQNGRPVRTVSVYDVAGLNPETYKHSDPGSDATLLKNHTFGRDLELAIRHRSDQQALSLIRAAISSR